MGKRRDEPNALTRREVVSASLAGMSWAALGCVGREKNEEMSQSTTMPTVFLPHGGGPFSYVDFGVSATEVEALVDYWRSVGTLGSTRPRATVVVSAHWEENTPTVTTSARPPMLYDYSGFPRAAYDIQWPSPGDPRLAQRVQDLLAGAGIESKSDARRGFDHGTFVPMGRVYPDADVPCIQLSLKAGLDPAEHLAIGRALTPLRDEGVLIIGSGMSYHDTRGFMSREMDADADAFDAWLRETVRASRDERERRLAAWEAAPSARRAHPREEHLLPLMVVAGAAGTDPGSIPFEGKVFGKTVSAVHFG